MKLVNNVVYYFELSLKSQKLYVKFSKYKLVKEKKDLEFFKKIRQCEFSYIQDCRRRENEMTTNFSENNATKKKPFSGFVFGLILLLTFSAVFAAVPTGNAVVVQLDTYLWVMVAPNPAGVGQTVAVTFQLDKTSDTAVGLAGGDHFKGFTIKITKPDGTIETKGPIEAWATSGAFIMYQPTQIGTYTFQASFGGQWVNQTTYQRYFKPTTSADVQLTVQQNPAESLPDIPLPTGYWTRPISAENKGWWQISDNWLMKCYDYPYRQFCMSPAFAPYTTAPDTAHVLWKKPIIIGGLGGGPFGDKSYYTGLSYEQFYDPYILEGKIIYVDHAPTSSSDIFGTRCLDLYTGEEQWFIKDASIDFAQVFDIENPNEHGLIAHLWDVSGPATNTTAVIYDGFTGIKLFTITNITYGLGVSMYCGAIRFGPSGEILSYSLDAQKDRLILWNSSRAIAYAFPWMGIEPGAIYSPTMGSIIDGRLGIEWNVTISTDIPTGMAIEIINAQEGYLMTYLESKTGRTAGFVDYPATATEMGFAASLQKSASGQYPDTISPVWTQKRDGITNRVFYSRNILDGVYTRWDSGIMRLIGYNIKTGNELWRTEPTSNSGWGYFTYQHIIAYGMLMMSGYDGYLRAFDITNGHLVWEYYFGNSGTETVYGTFPTYSGFHVADGKVYVTNDEHSPDSVLWRGSKLHVVDAYTGKALWNISGMMRHGAISDGLYTVLNSYDGQVYTFGKGPSAITVSAPQTAVPKGTAVLISGTVTDQSPGQKGTPAISDEDMTPWMEYLNMHKPMPQNAKGVPVKLVATDPSGNQIPIGTTTSDIGGSFAIDWNAPNEGKYQITATFEGTNSYGGSYATTYLLVGSAAGVPQPTSTPITPQPTLTGAPTLTTSPSVVPTPEATPGTEIYIIAAAIVIIAVVVGVALLLRKKH